MRDRQKFPAAVVVAVAASSDDMKAIIVIVYDTTRAQAGEKSPMEYLAENEEI